MLASYVCEKQIPILMTMATVTKELLDAYYATEYRVSTPDGTISLRADKQSDQLRDLLKANGVSSCAFITAYNNYSIQESEEVNQRRQAEFEETVSKHWKYHKGEGVDPHGKWPAEPSLLILGIEFDSARELAYGQNAFLFGNAEGYIGLVPSLRISTSPGFIRWTPRPDGKFSFGSFILGGNSSGQCDAKSVAEKLHRTASHNYSAIIPALMRMGWTNVLDQIIPLEREKLRQEIANLKDGADNLQSYSDAHEGKEDDYWYFRRLVYEEIVARLGREPEWDEEEGSVRRMHYAACNMMGSLRKRSETEKEIKELEDLLEDPLRKYV